MMKSVFEHWPEIVAKIRERKSVFLALDYDGVLAPIAAQPDLALLPPINRELLERLVKYQQVKVAVISGRAMGDVRNHIRVPSIAYAGNHGAEIDLNGMQESHVGVENYRPQLVEMRTQLEMVFGDIPGILLEDKGSGIGLHYREVDPVSLPEFKERFNNWCKGLPDSLVIVHAKMMYEVRPKVAWNKGNAVWHVWQRLAPSALPICLGDDLTDEDGFKALLGQGINIYVGEERQSYAEYILHSQSDVTLFLRQLLAEVEMSGE
jgi:trehalose 6-phosphate phosphatase